MALTPMMQQYKEIKEKYSDCILFYRLGDFYEMFFEDALTASNVLQITLTGRDCGLDEKAPMCGIPYHSANSYIHTLIKNDFKVAICEQIEDLALTKGIVKRDVVRVITPGTITDEALLQEKKNNYLMCIYRTGFQFGLSCADITTGRIIATRISWGNTLNRLIDEAAKFMPSEIIINEYFTDEKDAVELIKRKFNAAITVVEEKFFSRDNCEEIITEFFPNNTINDEENNPEFNSIGGLLYYIKETQKNSLSYMKEPEVYVTDDYMVLDITARRHLEITESFNDRSKKGTLLWVLDKTVTSMGGRTLRSWLEQPLLKKEIIEQRLFAVSELKEKHVMRNDLKECLKGIYDVDRLLSKICAGSANARDMICLKNSIKKLPHLKNLTKELKSSKLENIRDSIDELQDVYSLIDKSIVEEPPVSIKDGDLIKDGFNDTVDKLRDASISGKKWIASLESSERTKTGIKSLKIGFNKIFGYYIDVTRSNLANVPDYFIRKQTLAKSERYITPELKVMEDTILSAHEKVVALEYELFTDIRAKTSYQSSRIRSTAQAIAELDTLISFADVADKNSYVMPDIDESDEIFMIEARHPVVEKMIDTDVFVPNDVFLNNSDNMISVITGPNMAGKSTYMRQTALIVIMAQAGCFVPATKAKIGLVDRIFTRVGASDDLASGQSTFMVEMSEVAHILNNATPRSLLILDEIGRGTSTYDGLSIAWSVIEHISKTNRLHCRTLFATHYHELTELEGKVSGVKNYCITAEDKGNDVIFLRKVIRGGADKSYGIQVAKLAGVQEDVIIRAVEILADLEEADINRNNIQSKRSKLPVEGQQDLFSMSFINDKNSRVIESIKNIDINGITPIEALSILDRIKKMI